MQQTFFSIIKKIYLFFFLSFLISSLQSNSLSYSEKLLDTHLHSATHQKIYKKVYNIYGHHKFCKRINFYYQAEIKKINNKEKLILNILLMDNGEHEQEIILNNETLLNKLQWHCYLINKENNVLYPESIIKKEKDQHDIILFGKNHIPFGSLYIITFNLEYYQEKELSFNINQYDTEFIICLHI